MKHTPIPAGVLLRMALLALLFLATPGRANVTIDCPGNLVVECRSERGTAVTFRVTASSTSGGNPTVSCNPPSGSLFLPGATVVRCTAVEGRSDSASCAFSVTVRDTQAPALTLPPSVTAPCTGPEGASVTFAVSALDECEGLVPVTCTPPSGSTFPLGATLVACAAADSLGHVRSNGFFVTVTGTCLADCVQIICPPNIEVTLGSGRSISIPGVPQVTTGIRVDFHARATNTCTGIDLPVDFAPSSGSLFTVGTHDVTAHVVDGVIRKVCSFKVTVKDVTSPRITVPSSFSAPCNEVRGDGVKGRATPYTATATDNSGSVNLVCTPPPGSFFPMGRNLVECVASDPSGNRTTNRFTITITSSLLCEITQPLEAMPDNWGFELGLTAWDGDGDAFADQPVKGDHIPVRRIKSLSDKINNDLGGDYWREIYYPIGHQGDNWIGTAEDPKVVPGGLFEGNDTETRTGVLRSKSFVIDAPYISFLIGGNRDDAKLRVELLTQAAPGTANAIRIDGIDYTVWSHRTGHDREVMRWEQFSAFNLKGKRAVIRIIDNSTTGHLNVDDFKFEKTPLLFQTAKVGDKIHPAWIKDDNDFFYRWDSPVWGFADLHTHPMSHLGFGEAVMRGQPDGDAADALANCQCFHGIPDPEHAFCGDFLRGLVMKVIEDGPGTHGNGYSQNPYTQFNAWPVFWTKTHQQMWHEWMKRAHQGGLRTIVALCVNNPMLAIGAKGLPDKNDDKYCSDVQIDALVEFVSHHSDFMEIALDPFQLRDIVRRDKLAVIIGSELDDIGNFARNQLVHQWKPGDVWNQPSASDKTNVVREIRRLYDKGLRYIFPVHLMDNSFGGTAVGNDMLNVANKFLNHEAFRIEPGVNGERINHYLQTLDFTEEANLVAAGAAVAPAVIPLVLPFADTFLSSVGVPPGLGAGVGAGLAPLAIMGAVALPIMGVEVGNLGIPYEVLPIDHHYPEYHQEGDAGWEHGHKNMKGLTPLGEFAIVEMMKLGMMIDVDHMSQNTLARVIALATNNPVGYPLNSGHNSPRNLGLERGENSRTDEQYEIISELGGLFGVGWENGASRSFNGFGPGQSLSVSDVPNDCAGSSKTFAQYYLYGIEAMRGRNLAFGTDINGIIQNPGPRFGPMAAYGLGADPKHNRNQQVSAQDNGVAYTPTHGRPVNTAVFQGPAVDPGVNWTFPRTELGYSYNIEQGDMFSAIRIFYHLRQKVQDGPTDPNAGEAAIRPTIVDMASAGVYANQGRVLLFAMGLLRGIHDWPVTTDAADGNVELMQKIGKAVYDSQIAGKGSLPQYVNTTALKDRFTRAVSVWHHYHRIFGDNTPLKRCRTGYKEWDINLEGVAHYGLVPDFLQDLSNVGLEPSDMSVLFKSAEHFAQMWTKTLNAAEAIHRPQLRTSSYPSRDGDLFQVTWYGEAGDRLEMTDRLGAGADWRPVGAEAHLDNGVMRVVVTVDPNVPGRFFRVRKP